MAEKTVLRIFPAITQNIGLYFAIFIVAKIKITASNREYGEKCIQNMHTNAHIAIIKIIKIKTGKNKKEILSDGL